MSFQDELRANLHTKEQLNAQAAQKARESIEALSTRAIRDLKDALLKKAKNADYSGNTISAICKVSCSDFLEVITRDVPPTFKNVGRKGVRIMVGSFYVENTVQFIPGLEREFESLIARIKVLAQAEGITISRYFFKKEFRTEEVSIPYVSKEYLTQYDLPLWVEGVVQI